MPIHNRAIAPAQFPPAETQLHKSFYRNIGSKNAVSRRAIGKGRPDQYLAEGVPNSQKAQLIDLLTVFEVYGKACSAYP